MATGWLAARRISWTRMSNSGFTSSASDTDNAKIASGMTVVSGEKFDFARSRLNRLRFPDGFYYLP